MPQTNPDAAAKPRGDSPMNDASKSRADAAPNANGRAKPVRVRRVPRQERSKILVDCIRIAASEILKKDGPKALTTNNIAARAGVSIGSLYQYFANKEQILEEVFREHADRRLEDSREWADWVRTLPLQDLIRVVVERAVKQHREFHSFHPEFYQKHHRELDIGLRPAENSSGAEGEPMAVTWLREVFENRLAELRVPDARLASVALAHGISATLHGLVESEQGLLYDESIVTKLTEMTCGFLLRDDAVERESVEPAAGFSS
ncbi:MAG: TetR/AcrR family transcriptional regulator [bacterium]|nr:TetR/AcrR family transcriptional regulator [bacterium]